MKHCTYFRQAEAAPSALHLYPKLSQFLEDFQSFVPDNAETTASGQNCILIGITNVLAQEQ